jgi:hypothetical protein
MENYSCLTSQERECRVLKKRLDLKEDKIGKCSAINVNRPLREKAAQSWVYAAKPLK